MLEARLLRVSLASAHKPHVATRCFTWSLDPARHPALALAPLPDARFDEDGHYFGMYVSERKAQNEVLRLAREHRLCHSVLGIRDDPSTPCLACASNPDQCAGKARRLQQLTRSYCALEPLRVKQWPNDGPIGIRERAAIHLFDDWRYIGTVRDDGGIADALALPRAPFNHAVYRRLVSLLPALPARRLVRFCGKKERGGTTEPG
jgi:DNA polymerase-3 subunit epsilon